MATASKKTNGRASDATAADLTAQIETLRDDLSALTKTIADLSESAREDVAASAKSKAEHLRGKAEDTAQAAQEQAARMQGQANEFIRNQPATALGIAAGLGFLIGLLGARR